jgi:hypothetical protein
MSVHVNETRIVVSACKEPSGCLSAPIGTGLAQAPPMAFDERLARSEVAGSLEIRLLSEGGLGLLHG